MKNDWRTVSLGDIANVSAGNPAPQGDSLFSDGCHPFFRTADAGRVRFGTISDSSDKLNQHGIKGLRRFPRGTILFPKSGASTFLNHRVILGVDGYVSSHLAAIVTDKKYACDRFLLYYLSTVSAQGLVQDHSYPSLNLPTISSIRVPLPPLPEQQRIVAILDEAFEAIATAKANTQKNLQNARALFESALGDTLSRRDGGWIERRLSEVSSQFGRGRSRNRPRNDPSLYGGDYPFIQTGDVRNSDHYIEAYEQTYNEAGLAQSKLWPAGTVCITIAANIAETGILTFDACFPDSVIGVVPDDRTDSGYLEYLLQGFKVQLQAQGKGSAQMNINMATFEDALFPFPSLDVQRQVATKLDTVREHSHTLKTLGEQKLRALEELQSALLHQAFTGNL